MSDKFGEALSGMASRRSELKDYAFLSGNGKPHHLLCPQMAQSPKPSTVGVSLFSKDETTNRKDSIASIVSPPSLRMEMGAVTDVTEHVPSASRTRGDCYRK